MRRQIFRTMIALALLLVLSSCAGNPDVPDQAAGDGGTPFLSRPRFEKPIDKPFGLTTIPWTAVDGATGYTVQAGGDGSFSTVLRTWTVKGTGLDVPQAADADRWFRVRAFNQDGESQWSPVLFLQAGGAR